MPYNNTFVAVCLIISGRSILLLTYLLLSWLSPYIVLFVYSLFTLFITLRLMCAIYLVLNSYFNSYFANLTFPSLSPFSRRLFVVLAALFLVFSAHAAYVAFGPDLYAADNNYNPRWYPYITDPTLLAIRDEHFNELREVFHVLLKDEELNYAEFKAAASKINETPDRLLLKVSQSHIFAEHVDSTIAKPINPGNIVPLYCLNDTPESDLEYFVKSNEISGQCVQLRNYLTFNGFRVTKFNTPGTGWGKHSRKMHKLLWQIINQSGQFGRKAH